jgi:predicted TIM-barrel fold metal-dependent hydrolase
LSNLAALPGGKPAPCANNDEPRPRSRELANNLITDCHIHIQPLEMFKPAALALIKKNRTNFDQIAEFCNSPKAFLKYLDSAGVGRAVLINYVAPEVIGFSPEVNQWVAGYARTDPRRLVPCGGLHPRHSPNIMADVEQILRLKIRMIKIHPPHQLLFPNDYLHGVKELEIIYRAAEANGVPVMFHTGTSIFHGARNKYGDPIYIDDVAVDFPKLKIVMAHGGRPLWMQTAFFLLRRHPNVFLDISGIPPKALLKYFPRLDEIAHKTLFGTDWPGPGVPDIKKNLDDFMALALREETRQQILCRTALGIWPE